MVLSTLPPWGSFRCVAHFDFLFFIQQKNSSLTALRAVCEQVPPSEGFREVWA